MPPSKLKTIQQSLPAAAKPFNIAQKMYPSFGVAFALSLIPTNLVMLALREYLFLQIIFLPAIGLISFSCSLKYYTGVKFGAEHRFICTLLVKATVNDWACSKIIYAYLKWLYADLGKHTTYDDIAAFCYAIQLYEEKINLNKYGDVGKRVALIKPFFPANTPSNTLYKRFRKFEFEGSTLMPGT